MTDASAHRGRIIGTWADTANWTFRFLFVLVGVVATAWAFSGVHRIAADSQAVVFRFGRLVAVRGSGLLLAWPPPVAHVTILPSSARQIEFRVNAPVATTPDAAGALEVAVSNPILSPDARRNVAFLLTGDASITYLQASLFYRIDDPVAYVIAAEHVQPALSRLFNASAVETIAGRDLDTVLVARPEVAARPAEVAQREQLRHDLMDAINRRLDVLARGHASLGIRISRVDLVAQVPSRAKAAFDSVLTVTQEAQKNIADARTRAELKMQQTRQQRDHIAADATARGNELIGSARVHTAAITALAAQPASARTALVQSLYSERAGVILKRVKRVDTVDPRSDLHLILPGEGTP